MSEPTQTTQHTWQPEPDNAFLPVALGTLLWLIAGVGLLLLVNKPIMAGRTWWLGVCAIGAISGAGGVAYLRFRRARDARRAARRRDAALPDHPAGPQ